MELTINGEIDIPKLVDWVLKHHRVGSRALTAKRFDCSLSKLYRTFHRAMGRSVNEFCWNPEQVEEERTTILDGTLT